MHHIDLRVEVDGTRVTPFIRVSHSPGHREFTVDQPGSSISEAETLRDALSQVTAYAKEIQDGDD